MTEKLRIGIIGAGWAGSSHLTAFNRLPDVEVVGLWSRTKSRAVELVGKQKLKSTTVFDRWVDLMESDIDAISVTTPPALRVEPIRAALERKLHVLTEKPFTVYLDEARTLKRAGESADSVTAVSFNWRYAPGYQVAYRAVKEGMIGKVQSVAKITRFRFTGDMQTMLNARSWQTQTSTGGGFLRQMGSHEFDEIRFLTGSDVIRVVSQLTHFTHPGIDVEDTFMLLLELSQGIQCVVSCRSTPGQHTWHTVLLGEQGSLLVTNEGATMQRRDDKEPVTLELTVKDQVPEAIPMLQHTWNRLISDFCTAIRAGDTAHKTVPHLPTFADGLHTQELIAATELSHAQSRWVDLDTL